MPLADHIVILDAKGHIAEQGTWESLQACASPTSRAVMGWYGEGENRSLDRSEARDKTQGSNNPSDSNLQDITRKTGDVTLYSKGYCVRGKRNCWAM